MSKKNRSPIQLIEVLTRLAGQRVLWEPLIKFDPASRHYARLAAEREFEAWLLTWVPGQGTDWHDHGGSAGAFVILRGALTELHATTSAFTDPAIVGEPRELTAGTVRAFGTKHIHRVTNLALEPAISLHVYSPALTSMTRYEMVGGSLRMLAVEQAGADW
jgi:predicted metal-dependent enzyme (double-stranded beta helix superfamily)